MKLTIFAGLTLTALLTAAGYSIEQWNELSWLEKWAIWRNVKPWIQDEPPPVETEDRPKLMRGGEPLKLDHSGHWFGPDVVKPAYEPEEDTDE